MKTYLMLGFATAASMLSSSTSHALVSVVQDCTTQNGQYTIEIMSNEGIGPNRTVATLGASITDDSHNVVGGYAVDQAKIHAIGFGDPYVDTATNGKRFEFTPPDTNVRTYSIRAVLTNGNVLSDDDLKCSDL
jgi:hypothetical protein